MLKHLIVAALTTFTLSAMAAPAAIEKRLDRAAAFLSGSGVSQIEVEKSVDSEFIKNKTSTGEIHLGAGRFRWETKTPEASLVVFDGKTLWTEQPGFRQEDPPQVTKSELGGKAKDQILVRLLAGGKLSKQFKVLGQSPEESHTLVKLHPLKPDPSVKDVSVVLSGKPETLSELRYVDDLGNLTKIKILKVTAVKKPAKDLFKYTAPKGAEVSEL